MAAWELAAPSRTTTPTRRSCGTSARGGGRQLVRHEDNARRPGVGPLNAVVEMEQQTLTQGTQIAGPLFQITVAERGKLFGELLNDLF